MDVKLGVKLLLIILHAVASFKFNDLDINVCFSIFLIIYYNLFIMLVNEDDQSYSQIVVKKYMSINLLYI